MRHVASRTADIKRAARGSGAACYRLGVRCPWHGPSFVSTKVGTGPRQPGWSGGVVKVLLLLSGAIGALLCMAGETNVKGQAFR